MSCVLADSLSRTREILAAGAGRFFVAILDLNLPDAADGEVVDLVQSYGIPAVVLTGTVNDEQREALFACNIADYIEKNHLAGVYSAVRLVERIRANRENSVLVVDDSTAQRGYLCALLHNRGYRTLQAADGAEGLKVLRENDEISLVITDYNMPNMDGLEMVKQMRGMRSVEDLAIIGLSSTEEKGILPRFLKSGASDFMTKPFMLEELYCRIDQNLDMVRYVREAHDAANRDFLTHLYNRRYFFEQASKLHARARAGELPIVVAMLDADHFKRINDTHGHQVGDDALVAMANTLRDSLDGRGVLARFGGEEFVCLRVLAEGEAPGECMESLRAAVEAIRLTSEAGEPVPLTVSVGGTTEPLDSLDRMLTVADQGVYRAKEQGRNRVVMAQGG